MTPYERASRGGGYPEHPGYKSRQTSMDAAAGVAPKAMSLRARVFEALKIRPMTPEEVADWLGDPVHNIRPRMSELSAKGLIGDSGLRRRAMGGRNAIVWEVKNG